MVLPNTPNLTWTPIRPVASGPPIKGSIASTRDTTATEGEHPAQATRDAAAVKGAPNDAPSFASSKQALLGRLPMPGFLSAAH